MTNVFREYNMFFVLNSCKREWARSFSLDSCFPYPIMVIQSDIIYRDKIHKKFE